MRIQPNRWFQRIRDRLVFRARDRDMHEEMQFHVEALTREYVRSGLSETEARLAARRRFGSMLRMKERGHDARGPRLAQDALREVRHAARRLLRTPGFTLAVVLTLALAIGATVSIFTVVHRVVLNPLPYPDSDRLIRVDHGAMTPRVASGMGISTGLHTLYSEHARSLEAIAAYTVREVTLTGAGDPERLRAAFTTPSLAAVLRVTPSRGRWFSDPDAVAGGRRVAVLSRGLWMERFGGDADVIGGRAVLDGVPAEIVGIMPASFAFPEPDVDLWIAEPISSAGGLGAWEGYDSVARLRDGVSLAAARTDLATLLAGIGAEDDVEAILSSLKDATMGGVAETLWILFASVAVVLLVACANVANLFLARSDTRQRELAVRRALGAGGRGVALFFGTESAILAAAAGLAGIGLASMAVRWLVAVAPPNLPRLEEIRPDWVVVAFAAGLGAVCAFVFGAVSALHRRPPAAVLLEGRRSQTAGPGRHRVRCLLVAAQMALAVLLFASSGLMVRSVQALRAVDPGFDAESALSFTVGLADRDYPTRTAVVAAHQATIDRLAALPGVSSVGAASCLPLSGGCSGGTVQVEGRPTPAGTTPPLVLFRTVSAGYFESMGIPFVRGRSLARDEEDRGEPVAVVSETLARTFFPDENPIGRRVAPNLPAAPAGEPRGPIWLTIVGVVPDTPIRAPGEPFRLPHLYIPMSLRLSSDSPLSVGPFVSVMRYAVRTTVPPLGVIGSARQAIRTVDPLLAGSEFRPLRELLDRSMAQTTFTMTLLVTAAVMALMLGLVGVHAVVAYMVRQRTNEIGIRLALGAEPHRLVRLVMRQVGIAAVGGVAAGLVVALAGSRVITSLLYGVSPRDPAVYVVISVVLLVVALVACWLPARRSARINPLDALRAD